VQTVILLHVPELLRRHQVLLCLSQCEVSVQCDCRSVAEAQGERPAAINQDIGQLRLG
jgi:hypothetical protein